MGAARHRVGEWVLVSLMSIGLASCGTPSPSPPVPPWDSASPGPSGTSVPVAVEDRAALDRCMAAAGFTVQPARTGSNAVYSWERPSSYTWNSRDRAPNAVAAARCRDRFALAREKTVDELREIYARWVLERACLVSLGLDPDPPPPFEEFRAEWRTGPWMPIDGVPFRELGGEAKLRCGLEMLD